MAYRDYSPEQVEATFNPRVASPGNEAVHAEGIKRGEAATAKLPPVREFRYADAPRAFLDLWVPDTAAPPPVLMFFHGGYWRSREKEDYRFVVPPLFDAGAAVAVVEYDLCPNVHLEEIIQEARDAVAWMFRNGAEHGVDTSRIFIAGNSAGAHLSAMAMANDWNAWGVPTDVLKGCVAITGVYDLEPVLEISVNAEIRLTPERITALSPMHNLPPEGSRFVVTVGGDEPDGWRQQSADYAAALRQAGCEVKFFEQAGTNHFTITLGLSDPNDAVTRATLELMGL